MLPEVVVFVAFLFGMSATAGGEPVTEPASLKLKLKLNGRRVQCRFEPCPAHHRCR